MSKKDELHPVDCCIKLLRKDFKEWHSIIMSCPNYHYFKKFFTLAVLRLIAESMNEASEAELARRANMNRQTLYMFIRRLGLKYSLDYFWNLREEKKRLV